MVGKMPSGTREVDPKILREPVRTRPPIARTPKAIRGITQASKNGVSRSLYRWLDDFGKGGTLKFFSRYPISVGIGFGFLAAGVGIGNQMVKAVKWKSIDRPASLRAGPGYISWGKSQGMPFDHLSTSGIGLSLSSMRHTSIL